MTSPLRLIGAAAALVIVVAAVLVHSVGPADPTADSPHYSPVFWKYHPAVSGSNKPQLGWNPVPSYSLLIALLRPSRFWLRTGIWFALGGPVHSNERRSANQR